MSYLVFARKYRPQTFEQVVGQEHVTRTLAHAIGSGRVAHALLFAGPRGTGKTTVARILAKALNCDQGPTAKPCNQCRSCKEITGGHAADVFEIDGASNNSVDQIRELRENLKYMPSHSRFKIYIIDEVHMLSTAAFNALLKTLEEPPAHVLFMFATTEAHKIPVTILSRCQRHDLRRIDTDIIVNQMKQICDQEKVVIDASGLSLIAQEAGGSMRDALSLLDHVIACADQQITAGLVANLLGAAERQHLFELSAAVLARDVSRVLEKIDAVWRLGLEIKRFFADVVIHFHHLVLIKIGERARQLVDLPVQEIRQMEAQVRDIPEHALLQVLDLLFQSEPAIKLSTQPKIALEMIFLKMLQTPPALSIDTLIAGIDQLRANLPEGARQRLDVAPAGTDAVPAAEPKQISVAQPLTDQAEIASPQPPSGAQSTFESCWDQVLQQIEQEKPSLASFLKKCSILGISEGKIGLEVGGNDFAFKSIQKHIDYIEKKCSRQAGQALRIRLTANCQEAAAKQQELQNAGRLKQNALRNPMVMETLELFNGKVVDVKLSTGSE